LSTEDLTQRDEFLEFIQEEYEEIRADYFENLKEKKYLSLNESREKKLKIDWTNFKPR
jgi:5-methyltetrahydrofolate--homocysteine methyltransferase